MAPLLVPHSCANDLEVMPLGRQNLPCQRLPLCYPELPQPQLSWRGVLRRGVRIWHLLTVPCLVSCGLGVPS